MDLRYSESDERFRAELRAWLEDALPAAPAEARRRRLAARRAYDTRWQQMLLRRRLRRASTGRTRYGGRGATPTEHLIFLEETERAGAPYVGVNFVGLLHAGPT